jgi:filamentous hemagglutinin
VRSAQYANHIEKIITSDSSLVRNLSGGRVAFWDSSTQTVVIRNPNVVDKGTAFRPGEGIHYFLIELH